MNRVNEVLRLRQSIWLDDIRRDWLQSGAFRRLVEQDGVRGVTSNPSIFKKAMSEGVVYREAIKDVQGQRGMNAQGVYEALAIQDIQGAADVLRQVYDAAQRRDGYVSLEVSPHLAHDTSGTLEEARRLWASVGRDNVMIKVPGTPAGLPAVRQLIGEGINVNVTLLFDRKVYEQAAWAYVEGLEALKARSGKVAGVGSVASFFISRIDVNVDARLSKIVASNPDETVRSLARGLAGRVAVANAKLAYEQFQTILAQDRWQVLAREGAAPQRLLWASTGVKNPLERDVKYVEALIGPDTVNTVPVNTFEAFRDHGKMVSEVTQGVEDARAVMEALARTGVSMDAVTQQLLHEGLALFQTAFDQLLEAVDLQRAQVTA